MAFGTWLKNIIGKIGSAVKKAITAQSFMNRTSNLVGANGGGIRRLTPMLK